MKKLLHIVDMQNDFVKPNGKLSVAGANALVGPMNSFLYYVQFDKIIATFDTHNLQEYKKSDEGKMFPPHCIYGTRGWELAIDIKQPYTVVKKNVFDIWAGASAEYMNQALAGFTPETTGIKTEFHRNEEVKFSSTTPANCKIYIIGVASDYCVRDAIIGYLDRGFEVSVITDLCRGITRQIDEVAKEINNKNLHLITTKGFYNGR